MEIKMYISSLLSAAIVLTGCSTPPANETVSGAECILTMLLNRNFRAERQSLWITVSIFANSKENMFSKEIETSEISKLIPKNLCEVIQELLGQKKIIL